MAKSRRIKRSRKMTKRRSMKRRSTKRYAKRRSTKRRMTKRYAKRGGLTCYNEQGWPDRNGYYKSNGEINDDCPIKGDYETSDRDDEEDSWGNRRGY